MAALLRVLGALLVAWLGFVAVSDDDFARVVIAQKFAVAPHLDPTGTSWLPLPFWLLGGAMRLFGSSLATARVLAVVFAALASAAVAAMASAMGMRLSRVLAAAAVVAFMPWGMQLAVATVPESFAAALAAASAMSLACSRADLRVYGAAALTASCLSRYDAWPTTVVFAVWCALDARRARGRERTWFAVAALLALFAPVTWTLWQHFVYHDAFRYLGLVRSYRRALGEGLPLWRRVFGYPIRMLEELREVVVIGVCGLAAWWTLRSKPRDPEEASFRVVLSWRRPLVLAGFQLALLIAGDVRDGAPTHHAERALLGPSLVVIFAALDHFGAYLAELPRARRRTLVGLAVATFATWSIFRVHKSIPWYDNAVRAREVAAGRTLSKLVPPGERVLVDTRDLDGGSPDYGYYAVMAAFGRPVDVVVDRDQDPRKPHVASSFGDVATLRARLGDARYMLAFGREHREVAASIGQVVGVETNADEPTWSVVVRR